MATITGVAGSAINASCTVANDDEEINQTESSATAQSICNDLATIKSGNCTISGTKTFSGAIVAASMTVSGTAHYELEERSVTKVQSTLLVKDDGLEVLPLGNTAQPTTVWHQVLDMPDGATLTQIDFLIDPTDTNPPGTPPEFTVKKVNMLTGAATFFGGTASDGTSAPDYGDPHDVSMTGLSEVINTALYKYVLIFNAEDGAGADLCGLFGARTTLDVSRLPDAP